MSILNKCKKYNTFIKVKLGFGFFNNEEAEKQAFFLSMGVINYGFDFKDLELETLKNELKNDTSNTELKMYLDRLNKAMFSDVLHIMLISLIKMEKDEMFEGEYKGSKFKLTTNDFTLLTSQNNTVFFKFLENGKILLDSITTDNEIVKRNYTFNTVNNFKSFISNIEESVKTDDKVLDMIFV